MQCGILRLKGDKFEYDASNSAATDSLFFVNNTLHSFFSESSITANGIEIFSANAITLKKTFIEGKFSHNKEAKDTCLGCQGYFYEEKRDDFTRTDFGTRTAKTRDFAEV